MTALYNNSFDSSPNSDSDDDFMVDSIISIDHQPSNSVSSNKTLNCIPSWIVEDVNCSKMCKIVKINSIAKPQLKRSLSNLHDHPVNRNRCAKLIKLTSNKNQFVNTINSHYQNDSYFDNSNVLKNIDNLDIYNEYFLSNPPSPYAESDKTHSVESSPSCILLNDPIITSVVLNEKRYNSPNDSLSRLPFDDNLFNDLPTSFDKPNHSTSIDDNLLTPMRLNEYFSGTNQLNKNKHITNRNITLKLNDFTKIDNKRSRSIGSDHEIFSKDKLVRSSESLSIRKYVPISVVSETTSDCVHSQSTASATNTNYSKKLVPSNNGHNKRKHLLQFIIDLLKEGHTCVNWSNKKDNEFVITQPDKLALLWANYKNNNKMTFDSLARSLRLYYAPKKLERISGKKNHYRILNLSHEISFNL